jgi:hypothetical protein
MSARVKGNWGPYPNPKELAYIGSAGVAADGTVFWQSPVLGAISKPSTGNYQFEPLVKLGINIVEHRILYDVTQRNGAGLTFGVVSGLGPDENWFQVQFNNPIALTQQDTDFTVAVYQFVE